MNIFGCSLALSFACMLLAGYCSGQRLQLILFFPERRIMSKKWLAGYIRFAIIFAGIHYLQGRGA